jgi:uncharacterized protein YgiM (DUF1202 family)
MRKTAVATLVLCLFFAATMAMAEETCWVSSSGTTLKSFGSVSAEDVASLPVGTALQVVERAGRWVEVKTGDGQQGWVYAGRVADTAPEAEVSEEAGLFGDLFQDSQIQTAKADSARSIRGLSPETEYYARQRGTPAAYQKALDGVLTRKVSTEDLRAFLSQGHIGEYAL